jgi:hypothetical protein
VAAPTRAQRQAESLGNEVVRDVRSGEFQRRSLNVEGGNIRRTLQLLESRNLSFGSPEVTWGVVREMVRVTLGNLLNVSRLHNLPGSLGALRGESFPLTPGVILMGLGISDPTTADLTPFDVDRWTARLIGRFAPDFKDVIPDRWREEAIPPMARPPPMVTPKVEVTIPTEQIAQTIGEQVYKLGEELGERVEAGLTAGFEKVVATLPLIMRGTAAQPGYVSPAAPAPAPTPAAPAPAPAAPTPAAPQISEPAARNAWTSLEPSVRESILTSLFGVDTFTAGRVSKRSWSGLNIEYRIDLIARYAEWAPKAHAPPPGFRQRQNVLGEEGRAPVETSKYTNLAIRLEPRTLDEVYTDAVPSNTAAVNDLRDMVRKLDLPPGVVLWGETGGTGKTSMARAFARDYLRKIQDQLAARGSSEQFVTASGAPIQNINAAYTEYGGEAFALPATREAVTNYLKRPNVDANIFPYKKILIIDDAEKIPPQTVSRLKEILQANVAGETDITRKNIIIVTTNLPDFLVGTPLGSRFFQYHIQSLSPSAIADYLRAVVPAEGLVCDDGVFEKVAARAKGSLREALNELGKEVLAGHCRPVQT